MTDAEILELYRQRSENAIAQTQSKYGAYCRSVALRIVGSLSDAEECENDTYLGAWNSIPPHSPENLRTYLGRIARNCAISRLREKTADKRGGGAAEEALEELAGCLTDTEGNYGAPPDDAGTEKLKTVLEAFLDSLPARTRKVFVQRYWYLCPVKEIARDLGMNVSAVKMTLGRTREKLREALRKEGFTV